MSRQQLMLRLAATEVPRAEALLGLAGAESIALADAGNAPVLEPEPATAPLWPDVEIRAVFPATTDLAPLAALLRRSCAASSLAVAALHDEDWQAAIRQVFQARPIGARAWLAPADDTSVPAGRVGIRLHMGLAFGTGEHPTTALCLDWLEARLPSRATILDYGCGSGVLAIAALALGAPRGWAVDNDPQALAATAANAALNGVSERLFVAAPEALPPVTADVLAANILAGPLVTLAPRFAGQVRAGGALVLSGILEPQVAHVVAAYEPFFGHFDSIVRDGWVRLAAVRRAAG